jgi:hypothetical protein
VGLDAEHFARTLPRCGGHPGAQRRFVNETPYRIRQCNWIEWWDETSRLAVHDHLRDASNTSAYHRASGGHCL